MTVPPFSDFRAYITSPDYMADINRAKGAAKSAPREDWPVDVSHLARMHNELGNQCLRLAIGHFRREAEIHTEDAP